MAEYRVPTQQELDRLLYMQSMQGKSNQQIIDENLARGSTIQALPENFFQTASAGARRVGNYVNQAGNLQQIVNKLFPSNIGNTQANVQIPTSFNFAPKQAPTGEVLPAGLQTQSVPVANILKAIKPADVLGISGAERAYGDIGAGKAPQPLDVVDTLGVGAGMTAAGRLAAKGGMAAGRYIAPELGNMAEQYAAKTGLLQSVKPIDVAGTGLLQTAPKSDIGFYSAVEQAAMASPRKSGAGQAFLNDIMKGQDVRADEIKWMGLDDYLKGKQNVTKQEVQDYIANNRVNVQEVQLGAGTVKPFEQWVADLDLGYSAEDIRNFDPAFKTFFVDTYEAFKNNASQKLEAAKFAKYQLPGGENYRELLLTMPTPEGSKLYRSSHFNQTNILAHLRVNDRVDADGKKMLLIEEVQSDWHQKGRDIGYAKNVKDELDAIQKQMSELGNQRDPVTNRMVNEDQWFELGRKKDELIKQSQGVPDAPFKDTWYQLALKRAIQHAAENGYDRIGLTTAEQQIKRYPDEKNVKGMTKYYDETYPKFLEKYGKKWGAKVGETSIETERSNIGGVPSMYPDKERIRYLDITPEMKAGVSKGQPLFAAVPAIPAAGLLAPQEQKRR